MSKRLTLAATLLTALLAWSGAADATPEFPGVVLKTLDLAQITIDPPNGCTLCHATDSGGTALRPFGTLLEQAGALPYEDATLVDALTKIQEEDPRLIADVKAGRDPNDDDTASALPTPEYGCSQGGRRAPGGLAALAMGAALVALGWRRRGLRRSRGGTRRRP